MSLILAGLFSLTTSAFAWEPPKLPGTFGGCGPTTYPCLGIYTGDFTIVPPDWYDLTARALGGSFGYYRVEVLHVAGTYDITVDGRSITGAYYSASESSSRSSVYYVGATRTSYFNVASSSTDADFDVEVTGALRIPYTR